MSHVRLPLVCREFLMTCVETETLIREDPQCKELLLEAMKYHLLPEQRSLMSTPRTSERRPDGMKPYVFAVGMLFCYCCSLYACFNENFKFFIQLLIELICYYRRRKFICHT